MGKINSAKNFERKYAQLERACGFFSKLSFEIAPPQKGPPGCASAVALQPQSLPPSHDSVELFS